MRQVSSDSQRSMKITTCPSRSYTMLLIGLLTSYQRSAIAFQTMKHVSPRLSSFSIGRGQTAGSKFGRENYCLLPKKSYLTPKSYHTTLRISMIDTLDLSPNEDISWERYEMVALPDSMVDTTVFVGNLCEFVSDDELSELFQQVSSLRSVPACVARKPNASSLKYGFVTFPTVKEKEAAIIRFNGFTLNNKPLKVQPIVDTNKNRVRVPGKLVTYVVGEAKKQNGKTNTLRRISRDDVERLSRGQNSKKKGYGSRGVPHRLNDDERGAFQRAAKYGFVTLDGTGYRRGRKGSPLANIHRQWCDARAKPQIVLCKASGGRPLDNVIVDLSPLRLGALSSDASIVDQFLTKWKADILTAADRSGMVINLSYKEDNTDSIDLDYEPEIPVENELYLTFDNPENWALEPIWKLPVISLGVFEGERSKAKAMVKELAVLWDVMDPKGEDGTGGFKSKRSGNKNRGRTKMNGLSRHRQRRR